MNPFSGFMQAVSGSFSGFADQTANIGKHVCGHAENKDAILSSNDHTRSFLAWVKNFSGKAAPADAEGNCFFGLHPRDLDPELPVLDQLQALIAQTMDPSASRKDVSQLVPSKGFEDDSCPGPQGTIRALIAHPGSDPIADITTDQVMSDVPKMPVALEIMPTDGRVQTAAKGVFVQPPVTDRTTQAGLSNENWTNAKPPGAEPSQSVAKEAPFQMTVSGEPTRAEMADVHPVKANLSGVGQNLAATKDPIHKENPLDWAIKENTTNARPEKPIPQSLSQSVAADRIDGQVQNNRLIEGQLPSGMAIADKATGPAVHSVQPMAGQIKDSASMMAGLTDQQAAFPEDDAANFRDQEKSNSTPRFAMADFNEDDGPTGQSTGFLKGAGAEQARSHAIFQDTAKVSAGDPPISTVIKSTTGQAAAPTQTVDASAKTFQTTVMDQIVDKAAMRSIHGRSEIQIRLKPEFLGNVQMNIAAKKDQLVVRMMTDQPMVKEIVETHLHQLRTELQHQGLTIDKFEVMVNPDADQRHGREQFAQMFKDSSQNGRRQTQEQDPETLARHGSHNPDADQPDRDGINYFA